MSIALPPDSLSDMLECLRVFFYLIFTASRIYAAVKKKPVLLQTKTKFLL